MSFAQVLEYGVVNAIVIARLPEGEKVTRAEIDAFEAKQFAKTLGGMLEAMRRYVMVPPEVDALLSEALHKRNFLAHSFFREFADHFMIEKGRNEMLAWLQEAQSVFQRANKELELLMASVRAKYGITEEAIAKVMAEVPRDPK